jgi:hypothetical protein
LLLRLHRSAEVLQMQCSVLSLSVFAWYVPALELTHMLLLLAAAASTTAVFSCRRSQLSFQPLIK